MLSKFFFEKTSITDKEFYSFIYYLSDPGDENAITGSFDEKLKMVGRYLEKLDLTKEKVSYYNKAVDMIRLMINGDMDGAFQIIKTIIPVEPDILTNLSLVGRDSYLEELCYSSMPLVYISEIIDLHASAKGITGDESIRKLREKFVGLTFDQERSSERRLNEALDQKEISTRLIEEENNEIEIRLI